MTRLLLIEDDALILDYARELLGMKGYAVEVRTSAREGVEAVSSSEPFDVVVLDATIVPDYSTVVNDLRAAGFAGPIVLWTGAFDVIDEVSEKGRPGLYAVLKGNPDDLTSLLDEIASP